MPLTFPPCIPLVPTGFSRIPVHSTAARSDIRGFLLVKRLIVLGDEKSNMKIKKIR